MTEYRAHFDANVEFSNGGGLTANAFRLDVPSNNLDEAVIGRLFVQHLGLALVGSVSISNLEIVADQHRGSRTGEDADADTGEDADADTGADAGARDAPSVMEGRESTTAGHTSVGAAPRIVDLSHEIFEGLVTYPGLPAPNFTPHLTREDSIAKYAPGTQFALDLITMIGNTGTYLDSPFHRYAGGTDLAGLDLATLVEQPAEVFHVYDALERGIDAPTFFDRDVAGKAVLIHTGWDALFGTPDYGRAAPFLTAAGAEYLVQQGVTMVGIDSLNIDDTTDDAAGERPAHTQLLAAGIHVVEHLTNLDQLPPSGATFTAVPPRVRNFGTFPVRAYARLSV
ncbi:MAG: cyclase family protein [Microbacteriaceae bacterium]